MTNHNISYNEKRAWAGETWIVLQDVFDERVRQVSRYGHNEDLKDGTGPFG